MQKLITAYNRGELRGSAGHIGAQGPQGEQGPIGDIGIQGIQGAQGIQGIQGNQGNQGTQGIQGIQGYSCSVIPSYQTGMNYSYLSIVSMKNIVYIVTNATGSQMESPPSSKWTLLLTGITTADQMKLSTIVSDGNDMHNIILGANSPNVGQYNVAIGNDARIYATAGSWNTAIGMNAGQQTSGSRNIMIGIDAGGGSSGNNNVYIGNSNVANDSLSNVFKLSSVGNDLMTGDFVSGNLNLKGNLTSNGISVAALKSDASALKADVDGFNYTMG